MISNSNTYTLLVSGSDKENKTNSFCNSFPSRPDYPLMSCGGIPEVKFDSRYNGDMARCVCGNSWRCE